MNGITGRGEGQHQSTKQATANTGLGQGEPGEERQVPAGWKKQTQGRVSPPPPGRAKLLHGQSRKGKDFQCCFHPKSFSQLTKLDDFCIQGFYPLSGSCSDGKPKAAAALTQGKLPGIPTPSTASFGGFSGARRSLCACPPMDFGFLSKNNSNSRNLKKKPNHTHKTTTNKTARTNKKAERKENEVK